MGKLIRIIYQGLLYEHIKIETIYSVYCFSKMTLDEFIFKYKFLYKSNSVINYFNKNKFIQNIFIRYYMGSVYNYTHTDVVNFFYNLEDYEDYIIKEDRLLKIKKLLK